MSPRRRLHHRTTVAGLLVGLVVPVLPGTPAQAQEVVTDPAAATSVTAVPGDAQAVVSWQAPTGGAGAVTYTVTSDQPSDGCTAAAPTTTCTVTGLTNGTAYAFTVAVLDAADVTTTSAPSPAVTPAAPPAPPADVQASGGYGSATLTWTAPVSDGGSPVTGYVATSSPGGVTCTSATTGCTVTGLAGGTYTFTVTAGNGASTSPPSDPSPSVTVLTPGPPDAPTGVTATAAPGAARVSWTAPALDGGSPVTGYTVTSSPGSRTCTSATSPCTVSGLTDGTPYTFTVVATSDRGSSAPSDASAAVTPATVPGAPTGVAAQPLDRAAVVSWEAASSGGSAVSEYAVTGAPGGATCLTSGTTCTVPGLTNGTGYTFTVRATNGVGQGPASAPTAEVVPAGRPGAATAVTGERRDGAVQVSWTAATPNGSALTGNTVTVVQTGATLDVPAASTTALVDGLINGTAYTFTVTATNGIGSTTSAASAAVTPAGTPLAPTSVVAERGDGSATVTWQAAQDSGSAVTGYAVVGTADAALGCTPMPATATSCTVPGLVNGRGYQFTVRASNDVGAGATSAASNEVVPAGVPTAPGALTATRLDGAVRVTWSAADGNGRAVDGYRATLEPGGVVRLLSGASTTTQFDGLTNGTAYTVTVAATNGVGTGPAATVGPVTPAGLPTAPPSVTAVPADRSATVSWTAAGSNGSPVTGYAVTGSTGATCATTGALTCVVSGLTNGTSTTFTVTATNGVGVGQPSAPSAAVVPAGRPLAPLGVTAERGDGSAVIAWQPADGNGRTVTGYSVVSTTDPAVGCLPTPATATTCTVGRLVNGQTYAFRVTATHALGSGTPSDAATVTPAGVPFAPPSVTAVRGDRSVTLTWGAADGNGRTVTGYRVESTTDPLVGCTPAPATATGCTVTGLVNGSSWSFTVTATNAVGEGVPSAATAAVVPAGLPTAPGALTATRQDRAVQVRWTASSGNGVPVDRYTVTASPGGASEVVAGDATTAVVDGLANGTAYTFTVVATNAVGDSAARTSGSATPAGVPVAPATVTAQRADRSAVVRWSAAAGNGSAVTGYTVTRTDGGGPGCSTLSTDADPLSCTVTGLVNGSTYAVTVTATNAVGTSVASPPSAGVVPAGTPLSPATVTAARGDRSALLTWTAADGNGSPVTGYTAVSTTDSALRCTTLSTDADPLRCTVTGLVNGATYAFVVTATTTVGTSAPSTPSGDVVPAGLPAAPTAVTAERGDTAARVTWSVPSGNGRTLLDQTVTASPGGATTTVSGASTTAVVSGLANGTGYTFTVVARNEVGTGPASSPSAAVVPAGVPFAPTSVVATRGDTTATVSFTAPSGNGRPVLDTTVTASPGGATCTTGVTTCVVPGLVNGTSYTFTAVARNEVGPGAASLPSAAVVPAGVPFAPTGVSAVPGDTRATVSFTSPSGNGRDVLDHVVTSSPGGRTCTTSGTSCVVEGLVNGRDHVFTVVARNAIGTGPASSPSAAVVPAGLPFSPDRVVAVAGDTAADVTWQKPSGNGRDVIDHVVTSSPGARTCTSTGTACTVTGLTNGTSYTFTVVARNAIGTGPASAPSDAVVPAGVPFAPTGVTATRGDTTSAVSFTSPSGNGRPVLDHTVTATPGGRTCTTSGTTCTVTGLANGTSHVFTVVARNVIGTGAVSEPSAAVVPAGLPRTPTGAVAVRGDERATVSFTSPDGNGRTVLDHTVTSSPDGRTCTTTGTSCVVDGLVNGRSYVFTVVARTEIGTGSASAPSAAVVPAGVPFAATDVTATRGNASAAVRWTAAPANGAGVTGYAVTSDPHGRTCSAATAAGCTVTGLTNGVAYAFAVRATNAVGTGPASAASARVTPAGVPNAPRAVSAVAGDTEATVSWQAPFANGDPVTGYTVTSSPGARTCTTSVQLTCRITGLTNGVVHTFTVVARNAVGDGLAATSAGVVPGGQPFPPTGVQAVRGDGTAVVTWTAADGNGRTVTGYTATSSPDGLTCTATTAQGCTVTGLTNGTPYAFTVTATNSAGDSEPSTASSAVVPAARPAAPTGVTAVRGDQQAAVSWAPVIANGEPVSGHTVTASPGGAQCTTGTATGCTVTGLVNGTAYTFTVVAANAVGTGAASAPTPAVVPARLPSATGTPAAVPGDGSAQVSWPAAEAGGEQVTRYTVTSTPLGRTCTTDGATSCTVTGLRNGTAYSFVAQARNAVGDGPVSTPSAAVVPAGLPLAPTGVSAQPDARSAHVSWNASDGNGSAVTGYLVQASPGAATCRTTTATVCTVPGLTDGTSYAFTVTATNGVGSSTSLGSAAVVPADVPAAPSSVSVAWHDGAATVSWAPAADGGAAVTGYDVTTAVDDSRCSTTGTSCRVEGLRNGTPYTFTVTARNVMGAGAASPVTDPVVPAGVPLAATAVTARAADRSATVRWTAAPDNGRALLSQTVRAVASDGSPDVVLEVAGGATSALVTGLENGTRYAFTVTATNVLGTGPTSAPSAAVMPVASPTAPTAVTAVPGDRSAVVSWTEADGNGVPVTGYTVTSSPDGLVCTTSTTQCTVTGLTNGRAYAFTVVAGNAVGPGPASAPSTAVTPAGVPTAPTAVLAVPGNESAQVSWTPAQPNGSPLLGHTVRSTPGDLTCTAATSNACTVTGLVNGTAYAFTVTATNAVGAGSASTASAPVVPATVPGAPASVAVVAGDGSAQVSWPAASDGGSAVTAYTVTSTPGSLTCATTGATTCTVTGLANGTSYRFSVVAANRLGAGPASTASLAVVPATTPAAPTAVRALAGAGAAQVSWTAPPDGGRPVSGYLVTSSPGTATCRTNTATACTVTGLTNGTAYVFTVTATNAVGTGAASAPSAPVTPSSSAPALPPPPPDGPGPVAPPPAPVLPSTGPGPRSIDAACPAGQVPASAFTDVPAGSTHARAIDCLVWWKVANGRTATSYAPSAGVTRDAMAAFVARTVLAAKPGSLPAAPPNAFSDDDGSVHALAVDQLAAVGIVGGTGGGRYTPGAVVTRGQMARFLAGAVAHVLGTPLVAERDLFTDDAGSPFEADINRVATVGITGGRAATTYDPAGPVLRDQMGSFLARTLDVFVERGASIPR